MEIYYAIFYPQEIGGFGVRFPDAPAVNTEGKNIEDALDMAVDALSAVLVNGRKGREYQAPRDYQTIAAEAGPGELVFPVVPSEKAIEQWRPKKRINIMIPVDLLEHVDNIREQKGLDRSRLICDAVEAHLTNAT